jgi:secondary thiamine-phosphate synthase enzyme
LKRFRARVAPKNDNHLHNDIEARGMPDEPRNAHAHIAAMLFGASQVVPVADGALALGTWPSALFVELDGPRRGTVSIQIGAAA